MKRITRFILSVLFLFLTSCGSNESNSDAINATSVRGDAVGNGGNSIVCYNEGKGIKSIEFLDRYEARELYGLSYDLGEEGLLYTQKLQLALKRMESLDPDRMKTYQKEVTAFVTGEAVFKDGIVLEPIPDSHHLFLPKNCEVVQTVVKVSSDFPGGNKYIVRKDLWDLLSENDRAALVLHEIIYREATESHLHTDSVRARHYNSQILANAFQGITFKDYLDKLEESQLGYLVDEILLQPKTVLVDSDGSIKGAAIKINEYSTVHKIIGKFTYPIQGGEHNPISFWPQRKLRSAFLFARLYPFIKPVLPKTIGDSNILEISSGEVEFYPSGAVMKIPALVMLTPIAEKKVKFCGYYIIWETAQPGHPTFGEYYPAEFYENGKLRKAMLKEALVLPLQSGSSITIPANTVVTFSEEGKVQEIESRNAECK